MNWYALERLRQMLNDLEVLKRYQSSGYTISTLEKNIEELMMDTVTGGVTASKRSIIHKSEDMGPGSAKNLL